MKNIIAFIGRAGSGKDYQCNKLVEQGYVKLAFADALRDIAFSSLNIDIDWGLEHYDWLKENKCIIVNLGEEKHELDFRQFLQFLGTQGIRKYAYDFWCQCLNSTILANKYEQVCISDMRFINEYMSVRDFCIKYGYKYKVIFCDYKSDRYQKDNDHQSARMGNWFANNGYKDLQDISYTDMDKFIQAERFQKS